MGRSEPAVGKEEWGRWGWWSVAAVVFAVVVFAASVREDLKRARAGDWPGVDGALVERGVKVKQVGEQARFELALKYRYKVQGVDYEGGRVAIGDMSYTRRDDAKRDLDEVYPAGKPVRVYYNPENPSEAVLQPQPMSWFRTLGAGAFCALAAVAVVGSRVMRTRRLLGES